MADFNAEELVRATPAMSGVVSFLSSTEREGLWQCHGGSAPWP
jgi:hypothetical protein